MSKKNVSHNSWMKGTRHGTLCVPKSSGKHFTDRHKSLLGFQTYCKATSLHGWRYLVVNSTEDVWTAIFWLVMIFLSIALSVYFTLENVHSYLTSRTITTLDSTTAPLMDLAFPSLYLCNLNQVKIHFTFASIRMHICASLDILIVHPISRGQNGRGWRETSEALRVWTR